MEAPLYNSEMAKCIFQLLFPLLRCQVPVAVLGLSSVIMTLSAPFPHLSKTFFQHSVLRFSAVSGVSAVPMLTLGPGDPNLEAQPGYTEGTLPLPLVMGMHLQAKLRKPSSKLNNLKALIFQKLHCRSCQLLSV